MSLFRLQILILLTSMAVCGGAAGAELYRFVDGGRVSVIFSDTPPADARYVLYTNESPAEAAIAPTQYGAHIMSAAKATNVDAALIQAVISVESGYNPSARSSAGAVGLMQLMPGTARRYGVKDRLDPAQNIHGGARYLRDLTVMFDNNLQLVLAAYNAGEEAVMKYGRRIPPYRETVAYVPKVLGYYRKLRPATPATAGG